MVSRCVALLLLLGLLGCSTPLRVERREGFTPRPEQPIIYVLPFVTIMVPADVAEWTFDRFVDLLNGSPPTIPYDFVILKERPGPAEKAWLEQKYRISGEIFGYQEDSGCCSTLLTLKGRLRFHQPEATTPTLKIEYPAEIFFDHDQSDLDTERDNLAEEVATALASQLLQALAEP